MALINRVPLFLLYLNVLVVATCGLVYELVAGTLASYLLGDSVTQFSLVIGVYLTALGVGAWISRYVEERLARTFIEVELALALIGGASAPLLFLAFAWVDGFRPLLFGTVFVIGVFVGLELPLLMRILKEHLDFSDLVSRVLTFDYVGALLASLMFPIVLVPYLGLIRTSLLFGLVNALVGLWGTYLLRPILAERSLSGLRGRAVLVAGLLIAGMIKADTFTLWAEEKMLGAAIVHAEQTPYQRIVVTQDLNSFQLHLNGNLQFNSEDEYRYHEALVHPAMVVLPNPQDVLVLGGGDGLAVREILKYGTVESVTLVDIDPAMTDLATHLPLICELNNHALSDPRVTVVNQDAFLWLGENEDRYDVVIIDFPDPGTYSIGKLYTTYFFTRLRSVLRDQSMVAIQCTSPLVAPQSYWCVVETLSASGFSTKPYHVAVPSFGVWGFALASPHSEADGNRSRALVPERLPPAEQLRHLNPQTLVNLFALPADLKRVDVERNRLNNQILVRYYEQEWGRRGG